MKVNHNLFITLAFALLAMLSIGGFGVWQLHQAQQRFDYVENNTFPSLKDMDDARHALFNMRMNSLRFLFSPGASLKVIAQREMGQSENEFGRIMANYRAHNLSSAEDLRLLEDDQAHMAIYLTALHTTIRLEQSGRHAEAVTLLFSRGRMAAEDVARVLQIHQAFNLSLAGSLIRSNRQDYLLSVRLSLGVLLLSFLVSVALCFRLFRAITDAQAQLIEASRSDPLTGSKNRRYLIELGDQLLGIAQRTNCPLSVMFIDIDHFKEINDRFGHLVGDAAITTMVRVALVAFRKTDILGRVGGEEFVAVLPGTRLEGARVLAERFRAELEATDIQGADGVCRLTVSIGIAESTSGDDSIMAAIERADKAMYLAKKQGRNKVECFDHHQDSSEKS